MREFHVNWRIELDADSAGDAAQKALAVHRDPDSIATVFEVTERCECGAFHPEDIIIVDVDNRHGNVSSARRT